MDAIVGLMIMYFALLLFPLMLKVLGLGIIGDPMIKAINWLLLLPFRLAWNTLVRPPVRPRGQSQQVDASGVELYTIESDQQHLIITGPYVRMNGVLIESEHSEAHLILHREGRRPLDGWYVALTHPDYPDSLWLRPEGTSGPDYKFAMSARHVPR